MHQVPISSPYSVNWQSPVNTTAGLNAGLRLWYLAAPIFAWSGTGADGVLNNLLRSYQATAETGMQIVANGGAGASFLPRPGGWGCFKFSAGADQQIAIPGNLFASNAAGTIALWVMWDNSAQDQGFGSRYGYCTGKTNASSTYNNYILALTTNDADTAKVSWYPYSGSATATCTTTTTPGRWVWNHFCVTFKSGAHTIHVNGVQEDSGTTAGTMNSGVDNFLIGGLENSVNPSYLSGAVDDFRFYDRILSDTEVSQLYRESKSYYPRLLRRWTINTETPRTRTFNPAWAARCNQYSTAGILT